MSKYLSVDLFSGAGGMSEGLRMANFNIKCAFEIDPTAVRTYKMNHTHTRVISQDIRTVETGDILRMLRGRTIHLLAGCPPCQGFSSIRRLNRKKPIEDDRNLLIKEYVRFVENLLPLTIMLENVPGLALSNCFDEALVQLRALGYNIAYEVVNVRDYGVPQNRKRLVLVGSRLGPISVANPTYEKSTVRSTIMGMPTPDESDDPIHNMYPHHTERIRQLIHLIPHDGGSLCDLDDEWQLRCHYADNVGFHDVYGRLRLDSCSTTITGGCLNPSKGRFLHPIYDRCITAREASMLQTFPRDYKFPTDVAMSKIALMIGNALPPKFCRIQADNIRRHLDSFLIAAT